MPVTIRPARDEDASLLATLAHQGFQTALAGIALPNPASVAFHEAAGFLPVGIYRGVGYKLGAWRDVGWWQLELEPREARPREPRPFAALVHDPECIRAMTDGAALVRAGREYETAPEPEGR